MPIIKKIVWTARCDKCRKKFEEGALLPFVDSKKKLLEAMEDALWEIRQGKVLCDGCSFEGEK
jgi:ribosomal protein L37AE/L43A